MNIALLLAAGTDPTFRMDIPKQFVNVYNRPIMKNVKNEKCILQDLEYGDKAQNHGK